jgi:hypothetical protein
MKIGVRMTRSYVFLWDIDGVLADWNHRLMCCDRDEFYARMKDDPPIPAGVVIYNMLVTQAQIIGHAVQHGKLENAEIPYVDVMTCRPRSTAQITYEWFQANGLLMPRAIHMREDDDHRPHKEIKMDMYERYYKDKEEVLVLFEDNIETIKAFRDIGITVYQVCESPLH